jgi:hypothetical protein
MTTSTAKGTRYTRSLHRQLPAGMENIMTRQQGCEAAWSVTMAPGAATPRRESRSYPSSLGEECSSGAWVGGTAAGARYWQPGAFSARARQHGQIM